MKFLNVVRFLLFVSSIFMIFVTVDVILDSSRFDEYATAWFFMAVSCYGVVWSLYDPTKE